jgi:hypothetical protein
VALISFPQLPAHPASCTRRPENRDDHPKNDTKRTILVSSRSRSKVAADAVSFADEQKVRRRLGNCGQRHKHHQIFGLARPTQYPWVRIHTRCCTDHPCRPAMRVCHTSSSASSRVVPGITLGRRQLAHSRNRGQLALVTQSLARLGGQHCRTTQVCCALPVGRRGKGRFRGWIAVRVDQAWDPTAVPNCHRDLHRSTHGDLCLSRIQVRP